MPVFSLPGELPPPPPRTFFGRDELVEEIVDLVEHLTPLALVGAGGIGKTSIALTVLHDDRIKRQFGDEGRFIRCDRFPASLPHFLQRLSKAIGAGIDNPEDLTPLRSFLSSKDMLIVLDNAESMLDPLIARGEEIYEVVEELSQLSNVCLCITSRISTVPPDCRRLEIPTLSMEAACDTFYRIYQHGERSDLINNILEQLGFHPLSITLLATVAHHNKWDTDRLVREWGEQRTDMLQTDHKRSLAAAIELSLSSLMFQELGPDAHDLLGVIAFFPQGVDENNIDWLFPTIAGRKKIFDKLCVLSLTYRSDGFITMLAPIRDHLSPKDPASASLLHSTKDRYFSRLSVNVRANQPGSEETKWITSEDVNVEHLLDVFTTVDSTSDAVWGACVNFMIHLFWHKPRLVVLGTKIETLADDHPSKLECLLQLSRLFHRVGKYVEPERLLTHILKLSREQGNDDKLAQALYFLSSVHMFTGQYEEGMREIREASEVYERLGETTNQAICLAELASLLNVAGQLDAAEETASRAVNLVPENKRFLVCRCHKTLGDIYRSKGEMEKAIHHLEMALGIASSSNFPALQFAVHFSLALLFADQGKFDDAHIHLEQAKLQAANSNDTCSLALTVWKQAEFWHKQHRFEEAKSEALCALDAFEKVGAAGYAEGVREFLQQIDHDSRANVTPHELDEDVNGELLTTDRRPCSLILRIQIGPPNPNDGIDGCLEFFRCTLPQVINVPSLHPVSRCILSYRHYPTSPHFSALQGSPRLCLLPPHTSITSYSLSYRSSTICIL